MELDSARVFSGERLRRVAFPLGGIGSGMLCVEGCGGFSHVSLRGSPEVFNSPNMFSALSVVCDGGRVARVLEGPVSGWKCFGAPGAGNGGHGANLGLPRFTGCEFRWDFPFARVLLTDECMPFEVDLTCWSPFVPGDADSSSLPFAALEYRFRNVSGKRAEAVYSFNSQNIMSAGSKEKPARIRGEGSSFIFEQEPLPGEPWTEGFFCVRTDYPGAGVDCRWFRGGWFDTQSVLWKKISSGEQCESESYDDGHGAGIGASLLVPFELAPGEEATVRVMLTWYCPETDLRIARPEDKKGCECEIEKDGEAQLCEKERHRPWYSGKFKNILQLSDHVANEYCELRKKSQAFSSCFYDSTLPPEVLEAVSANLTILKSPTVLRQQDGRLWCWEGCCDSKGCCHGSCTHVWNYAQALPHLFPGLERGLRETEFFECQDDRGHQNFRASLPIGAVGHDFHAAADGQLGCVMKVFRDWRISADNSWLKKMLPRVVKALDYCIETWDPGRTGMLREPHHNTFDIEFWGSDGMCGSFYLGALKAAALMLEHLGRDSSAYRELYGKGCEIIEKDLFNGEYFIQRVMRQDELGCGTVSTLSMSNCSSPESEAIVAEEGPRYQYGNGCLSDGVLGAWMAQMCGIGELIDPAKVKSHLLSVHKYNFRKDLSGHSNPQRPTYALGKEGGLLVCSWPKGGEPTLPLVYSNEVWTGTEYQAAGHLAIAGETEKALDIVRTARQRYDGTVRNPFNEYECGHWYARALSSYGMLQAFSGVRFDAVSKVLEINPPRAGDFRSFLCTATGYGTVGLEDGRPFIEVVSGGIDVADIVVGKKGLA